MRKLIYVVCGLNASRSQVIAEFLSKKYSDVPKIDIKSAGLDVDIFEGREDDKRTLFTKQMAEEASLVFVSDHDKFYRVKYNLLKNDKRQIGKVHSLRIPDIFYSHKNVYLTGNDGLTYEEHMQKIMENPEFSALRRYIFHIKPEDASALMEALYIKELYSTHRSHKLRQDKKYPFQLLQKTLEFRFPQMSELIEK
jgi:hypothetical protein